MAKLSRAGLIRAACLALAAAAALTAVAQQPRPPARAAAADAAVPFRAGERLHYRVGWTLFDQAASLELRLRERRPFYGRHAWHFQAVARTLEPVRSIVTLDDQFDSYTDTRRLTSRQYEMYLRERGNTQDVIVRFRTENEPAWTAGQFVVVPAETRDPLGLLYYLRTVDWTRQPLVRFPVHDGRKLYQVEARLANAQAQTTVPAGQFPAQQIAIRVLEDGGEVRGVSFQLWLARNPERTPVRVEASLPFGTLRVELERIAR
jgi:hypothetical protein